jgi:hypothetical protein
MREVFFFSLLWCLFSASTNLVSLVYPHVLNSVWLRPGDRGGHSSDQKYTVKFNPFRSRGYLKQNKLWNIISISMNVFTLILNFSLPTFAWILTFRPVLSCYFLLRIIWRTIFWKIDETVEGAAYFRTLPTEALKASCLVRVLLVWGRTVLSSWKRLLGLFFVQVGNNRHSRFPLCRMV